MTFNSPSKMWVRVSLGNDRMWGGIGNDFITADMGNDIAHGGDGSDLMYSDGGDRVFGDAGNDFFVAPEGDSILTGGSGDDRFEASTQSNIVITDFEGAGASDLGDYIALGPNHGPMRIENGNTVWDIHDPYGGSITGSVTVLGETNLHYGWDFGQDPVIWPWDWPAQDGIWG
jgi:hypothetical protein